MLSVMPMSTVCEVLGLGGWKPISITEALAMRTKSGRDQSHKRCIECHQRVQAHAKSVNGMAAHFEHKKKNPDCSLSDRR
jgi:hypothetical protein